MDLREIWNAIRGVIRNSFTFNDIKEIAGASGLPIHKLSHLQQKSLPAKGASKSELLDAIDRLLDEQQDQNRIIIYFIQEMIRRHNMVEDSINCVINKFGWQIKNGNIFALDGEKLDHITTNPKTKRTVSQLIAQGENHTLEFKETLEYSVRESKQDANLNKECLKTIAAFLNANGGTLLIGVRDNGEISGIDRDLPYVQRKNEDGFQLKLRNLIKDNLTPFPLGKIDICFEKTTKATICRVNITPAPKSQVIHLGKDVYIRDGNTTRKLEGRDLTEWIQQRGK